MVERYAMTGVAVLAMALMPALAGAAGPQKWLANKAVVNVYERADAESPVVTQAIYGDEVTSLGVSGRWLHIRMEDEYTGWAQAADLHATTTVYAPEGRVARVTTRTANVYREHDVRTHAPLYELPFDARLETMPDAAGQSERWLAVKLVDGRAAWIQRAETETPRDDLTVAQMLELGKRFMGVTYTWGGVSSLGFDCSGLTQMMERHRGVMMPRDADVQATWEGATTVERAALQPGDLLFFGQAGGSITHTGVYLGNGEFLHDSPRGVPGVQVSKLEDAPWPALLRVARRPKQ